MSELTGSVYAFGLVYVKREKSERRLFISRCNIRENLVLPHHYM